MRTNEAFPGNFLKAADLQGKRVTVTIAKVVLEDIGDETKPVLHFVGKEKGLVLNKTNANMIAEITGTDEMDDWAGAAIVLYPTKVDFQGKRVDATRIDYPAKDSVTGKPRPKATKPEPAPSLDADDDPIPF